MSSKESVARAKYYRQNGTSVTSVNAKGVPSYKRGSKSRNYSILNVIFIILLVVCLFQVLNGITSQRLTFTGFLNWARDFHPTFKNVAIADNTIGGYWGILLDGFRLFINAIVRAFDFAVWLSKVLINVVSYVAGITRFLFGI